MIGAILIFGGFALAALSAAFGLTWLLSAMIGRHETEPHHATTPEWVEPDWPVYQ
ncbi:hypothetical protein KFK14_11485 [Sphingobium phenoxybenzoativorans]|uniref:Uncharacterized protein n=1 Tax=Sphingobium phenoxybenzoativorans TaxID=1592790 RepID=A0A975KAR4_9SPHN|nr:hypothetical protein [Sphingobium phenoxybenzoativorans]QUT07951.1 hypothetical protein KFK14_11485 [Sphingobium phenoxybenzoativorans]